jgi:catechol 2,3-dioxygenase-like lactoylglutathione lyase family enzyme
MAIELNWQTGAPVSPPGGFRGDHRPPGEQSTPVTLDNHVTQVYTSKNGNRGTYFRDPDGHLMEILTAAGALS